jgi:ferritin-like metal-binding protein YciE
MDNALGDLFIHSIRDAYDSEVQIINALAMMEQMAAHPELRRALGDHLAETRTQLGRLEEIARVLDYSLSGGKSHATTGLIQEARESMDLYQSGPVRDAAIIAGCQKIEHYEIASYGTLVEWSDRLHKGGLNDLLKFTLKEEQKADSRLNTLAKQEVNYEAKREDESSVPSQITLI